jgi:tRNA(fMet)-specific endonuclease VapC
MKYMLDTDTASFIIKNVPRVTKKALENRGFWCVSSVVYQELMMGLIGSQSQRLEVGYEKFLKAVKVLDFTQSAATVAAEFQLANKLAGHNIGDRDNQIAGHAASLGLILVSNNQKHFQPLRGLQIENWV